MIALGGLGEVGRNMHVIEYNGRLLTSDCGAHFHEDNQPGVDLFLRRRPMIIPTVIDA